MLGQMLSHNRFLNKIGAGGMGEVYKAHDERLDRDLPVKVVIRQSIIVACRA